MCLRALSWTRFVLSFHFFSFPPCNCKSEWLPFCKFVSVAQKGLPWTPFSELLFFSYYLFFLKRKYMCNGYRVLLNHYVSLFLSCRKFLSIALGDTLLDLVFLCCFFSFPIHCKVIWLSIFFLLRLGIFIVFCLCPLRKRNLRVMQRVSALAVNAQLSMRQNQH